MLIMRGLLVAVSSLAMIAAVPAAAQLLGGSAGGGLGGGLGGAVGGTIGRTTGTITGADSGAVETRGSRSVDRRSGRVRADRSVEGRGNGSVGSVVDSAGRTVGTSASGEGNGRAGGSVDAQLIGTDGLRDSVAATATSARGLAANTAATARGAAGSTVAAAGSAAGSVAAQGSSAAQGGLALPAGQLALAGTAAGSAAGAFTVAQGTDVLSERGRAIGTVRQVFADGSGRIQALLINVEGSEHDALVPATAFDTSGNALVSAMSRGSLEEMAEDQAEAAEDGEARSSAPAGTASGGSKRSIDDENARER